MASLKNKAGTSFYRFTCSCEKMLKDIQRKRDLHADICVDCGHAHLILTMTEDGYKCDGCLDTASVNLRPVSSNDIGKVWSF